MDKLKVIKRINQRLAIYEKAGLTESYNYQNIISTIRSLELPVTKSKSGHLRISRGKLSMENMNEVDLAKVDRKPSLAQERQKARKKLKNDLGRKPTKQEEDEFIKQSGALNTWIDNNLDYVYMLQRSENEKLSEASSKLISMMHNGLRNYKYDVIWDMIHKYEKLLEQSRVITDNADMNRNDDDETFTG